MRKLFLSVLISVCTFEPMSAQVDSAVVYNNKAASCLSAGDLIGARDFYKKAYGFTSDEMVYERVAICVNLAAVLIDLAEYSDADSYLSSADMVLLPYKEQFPSLVQELDYQKAGLASAVGDTKRASVFLEGLVHNKDLEKRLYMPSLRALLEVYMEEGRYETIVHKADTAMASVSLSDSLFLCRTMTRAFARMGKRTDAMKHLGISDGLHARMQSDVIVTAQQKRLHGEVAEAFCDYQQAYTSYQDAAEMLCERLGESHPETVSLMYGMAKSLLLMGDSSQAWKHYSAYLSKKIDYLSSQMFRMNNWEMLSYWTRSNEGLVDAPLFCHNVNVTGDNLSEALNAVMFAKSVTFDTSVGFGEVVAKSGDRILQMQYESLRAMRMSYGQTLKHSRVKAAAIKGNADALEKSIRKKLYALGLLKDDLSYPDWKTVAKSMDENTVAVEFVDFKVGNKWQYSAFLYRKGQKKPLYIPLCTEEELLQKMTTQYLYENPGVEDEAYDAAFVSLYDLIWKPLEAHFRTDDRICFSPSGLLNNIPMEYLESKGVMFAEKYRQVRRMAVTKNIPSLKQIEEIDRLDAFGAIEYRVMSRSRLSRLDFQTLTFGPEEIDNIRSSFETRTTLNLHTGMYATEMAFKQMNLPVSGHALLHLSTHGYYCPLEDASKYRYYSTYPQETLKSYPLLRCGLAMAGANRAWRGLAPEFPGDEDGILTAHEISEMDLRGASLVVLAACQTGLGDTGRDGVQGFQRAFRLAGARSLLVSLWPVDDECTMKMMTYFYEYVATGVNVHESLVRAARKVKDESGSPYFYAPYVIVD